VEIPPATAKLPTSINPFHRFALIPIFFSLNFRFTKQDEQIKL